MEEQNFKFNRIKLKEAADKLGIKIKFNSEKAGVHFGDGSYLSWEEIEDSLIKEFKGED